MTQKKIDSILNTKYYHIFYKNKELKPLAQETIKDVEKAIKENINPPKTDKKIFIIRLNYKPNSDKKKIIINCSQRTISPKLKLVKHDDDDSFSITYSAEEYKKYKFSLDHIKKIINKIKKDELDFSVQFINISKILDKNN